MPKTNSGEPKYRCEVGSWAWVATDEEDQEVACQYGWIEEGPAAPDGVTNNLTEMAAALAALGWMGRVAPGRGVRFFSDSGITIGRLSQGWKLKGIPEVWMPRIGQVLASAGPVEYTLLKGHPTKADLAAGFGTRSRSGREYPVSRHQVKCDTLCNEVLTRWSEATGITR